MSLIPDKWFQKVNIYLILGFFTLSHGGRVGVHNSREKILLVTLFY